MLLCVIGSAAAGSVYILTSSAVWLGVPQLVAGRTYLTLTAILLTVSGLTWTALALAWTIGLGLRYPAPFIGMPGRFSGILAAFFVLSHTFPAGWKVEPGFLKQKRYLLAVFMATEGLHMVYFALEMAFVHVPAEHQWLLALVLPLVQEGATRAYSALCDKALGFKDVSCELIASNFVMTFHSMFLSIVLASSATAVTSYLIFGISILQVIVDTLRVVRYKKQIFPVHGGRGPGGEAEGRGTAGRPVDDLTDNLQVTDHLAQCTLRRSVNRNSPPGLMPN
jgi:hypothetical protein